jgi:tetratricopeptide (TPR) repeat protein
MDPADNAKAWERLQRAVGLAPKTTPREQAFIHALEARYAASPPDNRRSLDEAYASSTAALAKTLPDDLDARVFHAEALMDLQPWDYYDEQLRPKGNTAEIVSLLESVIAKDPNHAGALHLYVHAVEASADPQRGVIAADRLRTLIPGSGHLVHMPAHIYARVGRWHDAVIANQVAIEADNKYLSMCRGNYKGVYPLGYVPHNPHFLWFAASMAGESRIAQDAARQAAKRVDLPDLMRQPGYAGLQHYWMTPWFDDVRFGRWADIAARPNPAPDLPYVTAIWHYAEAMAAVRQQRLDDARRHHAELTRLAEDPHMDTLMVWDRYPLATRPASPSARWPPNWRWPAATSPPRLRPSSKVRGSRTRFRTTSRPAGMPRCGSRWVLSCWTRGARQTRRRSTARNCGATRRTAGR